MINITLDAADGLRAMENMVHGLNNMERGFNNPEFGEYVHELDRKARGFLQENVKWIEGNVDATTRKWKKTKRKLMNASLDEYQQIMNASGFPEAWAKRGQSYTPFVSDRAWKATGKMEEHLLNALQRRGTVRKNSDHIHWSSFDWD